MPKTIWQKKIAAKPTIPTCLSLPKHEATDAAHHTTAHANCIFQRRISAEVPLAIPSMPHTTAMKTCQSVSLPLLPSEKSNRNIEMPSAIHTDPTERPRVVSGLLLARIETTITVTMAAATMVTGHAKLLCPSRDQPM